VQRRQNLPCKCQWMRSADIGRGDISRRYEGKIKKRGSS
jgi:hypothetical protein